MYFLVVWIITLVWMVFWLVVMRFGLIDCIVVFLWMVLLSCSMVSARFWIRWYGWMVVTWGLNYLLAMLVAL